MTFSLYGVTAFDVQYWNGSSWVTVTGGSVTGNNSVWRKFTFTAITTSKIRVVTNASASGWSELTELEAWTAASGGGGSSAQIHWLVTDQLGTPRMVFDQTGSLANVSRHDYLPFGEELFAGVGGRTTAQGYMGDSTRQKFTSYERDSETSLDFAQARYYSGGQARFTSADPLAASADARNPQTFNRYAYALNSPQKYTDPSGLGPCGNGNPNGGNAGRECTQADDLTQKEFNGALTRYIFERLSQGYWDDTAGMTTSMYSVSISEPEPQIVFDGVQLLDDHLAGFPEGPLNVPRPINPIRSATTEPLHLNEFTLDVDHPEVDTKGIMAIRVKFHVIDGYFETVTVNTTTQESRRWRVAGGPMKAEGGIIFHANVYDPEARINPINVTVRARWTASIWDKGKLNDVRYKSAEAEIILRIGQKDR